MNVFHENILFARIVVIVVIAIFRNGGGASDIKKIMYFFSCINA